MAKHPVRLSVFIKVIALVGLCLGTFSASVMVFCTLVPLPHVWMHPEKIQSTKILDRKGQLLRETLDRQGGHLEMIPLSEIPKDFIDLFVFVEDKRFWEHNGIDGIAIFQSLMLNLSRGRIVRGGSTITQQLARLISPGRRDYYQKIKESLMAYWMERRLSKQQILHAYMNRAPFGNQLFGVQSASERYFRKNAQDLSFREASFLVGLVQAPSLYNPYKHFDHARARQDIVLRQCRRAGWSVCKNQELAFSSDLIQPRRENFEAGHFTEMILEQLHSSQPVVYTSLDVELQRDVETIVTQTVDELEKKGGHQAGVLVLDTQTAEVLAWVGSRNFWDDEYAGMTDAVISRRQPGSALKPFTYALALEEGYTPSSILADIPTHFSTHQGEYTPVNYDRKYYGPVRLRIALANSLNIPAVRLMENLKVDRLMELLKNDLHFQSLDQSTDYYGLGLTLGNGEVTLKELTLAYSVFGRQNGRYREMSFLNRHKGIEHNKILFKPETLFLIKDILSDNQARSLSFGQDGPLQFDYPVIAKTGTSSSYRDNWAFGVTPEVTVGVWVGNFNGAPMQGVSGVTGAAPLMHQVMERAMNNRQPDWPKAPESLLRVRVCPLSGQPVGKHCHAGIQEYFPANADLSQKCIFHQKIWVDKRNHLRANDSCPVEYKYEEEGILWPHLFRSWSQHAGWDGLPEDDSPLCPERVIKNRTVKIGFPEDGAVFKMSPDIPQSHQRIGFKVKGNASSKLQWKLNGNELSAFEASSWPLKPGQYTLKASDDTGSDQIRFQVR